MTEFIIDTTLPFDKSVFHFTDPKVHAKGGKVVNCFNRNSKESAQISLPLLLSWGAQESLGDDKQPNGKFTMSLQFPSSEYTNPDAESSRKWFDDYFTNVKEVAMKNSLKWFGKEIKSMDVIDEKFSMMLRYPKLKKGEEALDFSKSPTLPTKIPQWGGMWKTEIYDEDGQPLFVHGKVNPTGSPLQYLPSKCYVITLLESGGLWFVNGKISITWNLRQAIVQKPKERIEGQLLLKPKAGDKRKLKELTPPEEDPYGDGVVSTTLVDDSDTEQDSDEVFKSFSQASSKAEPEREPEPESEPQSSQDLSVAEEVKQPKKKIVKKTKN
jgi:hypothetical protein